MFTVEHVRKGAVAPITVYGPFDSLEDARAAGRKVADTPPGLITGTDSLRILQDGTEVESYKAGDL